MNPNKTQEYQLNSICINRLYIYMFIPPMDVAQEGDQRVGSLQA